MQIRFNLNKCVYQTVLLKICRTYPLLCIRVCSVCCRCETFRNLIQNVDDLITSTLWGSQYEDRVMWCHCDHRIISRVDWVRTGNGFWGICLLIVNWTWWGKLSVIYLVIRCFSHVHSSTLLSLYVQQEKGDVWTEAVLLLSMLYVCIWQSLTM